MDNSEGILKYLPIGTALLIFSGAVHLIAFYSFYNITITNYITIGEILISFLDVLRILFPFLLSTVLISSLVLFKDAYHMMEGIYTKYNLVPISISMVTPMVLAFAILLLIDYKVDKLYPISFGNIMSVVVVLMGMLVAVVVHTRNVIFRTYSMIYLFCALQILIICTAKSSALKIYKKGKVNLELKVGDEIIKTDNKLKFIGKSENYLFLYDKKDNKATILKTDDIDRLVEKKITETK